ncbi:ATP-binding protein [Inhella gelatinilytica]|uniref:AAA family ATPase n=1 Tax=Inhella gelatinilytica TaxID=2795030 RepID=A0A931IVS6_9BURK|nr:ATP-binding protein [Inhella gelatinilytica]MBH9553074.1 AAA family ATPase [Inhella gelatinilytica]
MFHLQDLELLHWDYCQRVSMPLDAAIITIAGPNGSGKTTLLDALRTLLGLECSGGRTYKTYARHANAETAWLRATVDNRPRHRQNSSRPFASSLLYDDHVTIACRIERHGGDWQRRYLLVDGVQTIEQLAERPDKDAMGIEGWKRRLEAAGLTRAIGRVLALEQGQTDRLCELSPRELLRLVFEVFGDQEVLDRYDLAKSHQQQLEKEVVQGQQELAHAQAQLAELSQRVNLYKSWQMRVSERERFSTEVLPVLQWADARAATAREARELHRQRLQLAGEEHLQADARKALHDTFEAAEAARRELGSLAEQRTAARKAFDETRDAERPLEDVVKHAEALQALAAVEGDTADLQALLTTLADRQRQLRAEYTRAHDASSKAQAQLAALKGQPVPPPPPEVSRFRRVLQEAGIAHHLVADAIDIADEAWRAAAEGYLRGSRWVVVLQNPSQEREAYALAAKERFRHYVVADSEAAPAQGPKGSLLAALRVSQPLPTWLLRALASIRCVASTADGSGVDWITPDAYYRDPRGGRSLFVPPAEHQFGTAATDARRKALEGEWGRADAELARIAREQAEVDRQLKDAQKAAAGHKAAQELGEKAAEFSEARERLPQLRAARVEASSRWTQLDQAHAQAVKDADRAERDYQALQQRLKASLDHMQALRQGFEERRGQLRAASRASREARAAFPAGWVTPPRIAALREEFGSIQQAKLALHHVERELESGTWETDHQVIDRHVRMDLQVREQQRMLDDRRASNEAARIASRNARERYIEVLRATLRRYRKNVQELGELAGVVALADLPHLDNDDTVLAQAGLHVRFSFDGKGEVGLNDGEASGGQQVLKSLILLVGLMKDDDAPGGFVFIDEPFAHLDVRNIQLVGHFLKSTRAQYLLTTPITHNVEVFEPSDITLVTSKKTRGERWAPPIGVIQRRRENEIYG